MSRTKLVQDSNEQGQVQEIFHRARKSNGVVLNIYRAMAVWPDGLNHVKAQFDLLFGKEFKLDRVTKEMIAFLVGRVNQCHYTYTWNSIALQQHGVTRDVIQALSQDFRLAPLSDRQKAILAFAEKITRTPYAISDREVERLRQLGIEDEEIVEITTVASFTNAISRIVLALGITFET